MDVVMNCRCHVVSGIPCQNVPGHVEVKIHKAEPRCYHRDGDQVIRPLGGYKKSNEERWIGTRRVARNSTKLSAS
jgi:hypothetical protein